MNSLKLFVSLILSLSFAAVSQAKVIRCDGGFVLDEEARMLTVSMSKRTRPDLGTYMYTDDRNRNYFIQNFEWDGDKNAYFKSDRFSTVKAYYYENGEKAMSLVLTRTGYPEQQIKFGNCDF